MASQMIRGFLRVARERKQSAAALFMDLKNAFYSVERRYVWIRPNGAPTSLHQRLVAAGAPPELLDE
eukprot:11542458-Alexandrium_andersonii.AAC.1